MYIRKYTQRMSSPTLLSLSLAAVLTGVSGSALAAGFQLYESNAVNMGDFGAEGAVGPFDASIGASNPAGLTRIKNHQIVASGDLVFLDAKFKGTATTVTTPPGPGFPNVEGGIAQGGKLGFVPALHYATPINNRFAFGLNVSSPFGLKTGYADTSIVRYAATDSELLTINISPAFAFKVADFVSVGAGFDVQYADVTFNSYAGAPSLIMGFPLAFDTSSVNTGDSWGYGYHAGIIIFPRKGTRIGVNYTSKVKHDLTGTSVFEGPLAPGGRSVNNSLNASITLPATTTISVFQQVTDCVAVMASAYYTQWDVFQRIVLNNVAGPAGPQTVSSVQNFKNTWRITVGTNVKVNEKFMVRMGFGYDQTPTNNTDRFVRLPDAPRWAVAVGGHYQATQHLGLDFGYTHFFVEDARINNTTTSGSLSTTLNGTVRNNADLLGAQVVWDIA